MELDVAGQEVSQAPVAGNPRDYDLRFPLTYHRVELTGPRGRTEPTDTWQLKVKGNVKILRMTFELKERRRPGQVVYQNGGSFRLPRGEYTTSRLAVNLRDVQSVRLTRTQGRIELDRVTVVFGNGESRILTELAGTYQQATAVKVANFFQPRNIREILVEGRPRDSNRVGILLLEFGVLRQQR